MRAGAMAYFQWINAQGGVNGRKIELRSLDDGYEGDRAAANTRKLIDDGVFLLFGYVGTPTSNASKPIFTAAKVPFVGPFTGAESLRNPLNRYIFNIRASYYDETDKLVGQLVGQTLDRIAVFYQNDDYGKAGLAGVERAMTKRNMKIMATGTVERNTIEVGSAVKSICKGEPQGVVMISAYKSCAAFIKEARAAGCNPQFLNVSFVGSKALAHEAGPAGRGVGISQVVPFPWNISARVVKDYQQLLEASTGKQNYSFTSLEGFIAAKVLVEGLRRTGNDLTREKFVTAMEQIRDYDVGGFTVSFSPNDHSGSKFVELTVIGRDERFLR
jgi:ABC-type branched-subunit amino acid transport system substrate-binding protein